MCGPCSVESEAQTFAIAAALAPLGVAFLRGGAFKPRSSPYAFQGHGEPALDWMRRAADAHGMKVVTEALAEADVQLVAAHADLVQVGSRNMHNYALLKAIGRTGQAGPAQARHGGDPRRVAAGRRVPARGGRRGGRLLRARHPQLRRLHAQPARPGRGRAALPRARVPGDRRPLPRRRAARSGAPPRARRPRGGRRGADDREPRRPRRARSATAPRPSPSASCRRSCRSSAEVCHDQPGLRTPRARAAARCSTPSRRATTCSTGSSRSASIRAGAAARAASQRAGRSPRPGPAGKTALDLGHRHRRPGADDRALPPRGDGDRHGSLARHARRGGGEGAPARRPHPLRRGRRAGDRSPRPQRRRGEHRVRHPQRGGPPARPPRDGARHPRRRAASPSSSSPSRGEARSRPGALPHPRGGAAHRRRPLRIGGVRLPPAIHRGLPAARRSSPRRWKRRGSTVLEVAPLSFGAVCLFVATPRRG